MISGYAIDARLLARFWSKVNGHADPKSCWIWAGAKTRGYGSLRVGGASGRAIYAHRVSLAIAGREPADGLDVDHLCRVPACVNPDHLEAVTHAENLRRGRNRSHLTSCRRGHPYDGANTLRVLIAGKLVRRCRVCTLVSSRKAKARFRERERAKRSAVHV
jgi:hypothetical protein